MITLGSSGFFVLFWVFSTFTYRRGHYQTELQPGGQARGGAGVKGCEWSGGAGRPPRLCGLPHPSDPELWLEKVRGTGVQPTPLPSSLGNVICPGVQAWGRRGGLGGRLFLNHFSSVMTRTVKGVRGWGPLLPCQCHPWLPGPHTALNSGVPACPVMGPEANCGKKGAQRCPCGPNGRQRLRPRPRGPGQPPGPSPHLTAGAKARILPELRRLRDDPPSSSHRAQAGAGSLPAPSSPQPVWEHQGPWSGKPCCCRLSRSGNLAPEPLTVPSTLL